MRHGYGLWSGRSGEVMYGDWLLDKLIKGTIQDKQGKKSTVNQGGALETKHTNKTECDVALQLLANVHTAADLKREQIKFEVENIKMAIDGDLNIRIWNLAK